jgi:tetratricopeptide (TPR) repeat protein
VGRAAEVEKYIRLYEREGADGALTGFGAFGRAVAVQSLLFNGRYDRARALLRGLEAAEHAGHTLEPAVLGWIRWARLMGAAWLDADAAAALELADGALAAFEEAGDARGCVYAMAYQGLSLMGLGAFERAEQVLGKAVTMSEHLGVRWGELVAKLFLSFVVAHRGEVLSALALLTEVHQSFVTGGIRLMEGSSQRALAQVQLLSGDRDGALHRALRAVELTTGTPPHQAEALATLALVRARRGEQAESLAAARAAMAIVDELGSIGPADAGVRLAYIGALRATGDDEAARAALEEARERLVTRADKIRDHALRQSFLEKVHAHRRTLAMASLAARS